MKFAAIGFVSALSIAAGGASGQGPVPDDVKIAFTSCCIGTITGKGVIPNDAQIVSIVVTANQVDMDAGTLAESITADKMVKAFAKQMVTEHAGINRSTAESLSKLKVEPESNPISAKLQLDGAANVKMLSGLKGTTFDSAYIDHEVEYHQAVIDAIDETLIPNAAKDELKALLEKARLTFVAHLEHARKIQAMLGKKGS